MRKRENKFLVVKRPYSFILTFLRACTSAEKPLNLISDFKFQISDELFGFSMKNTVQFPQMVRLRQQFERPRVQDIPSAVRGTLGRLELGATIRPGQTVALTAGSRGIAHIPLILK